ncbi:DegT/DnrJ/EryC1/StrS family aminotransferase [Candidatus Pelagibacter sp.]|nr:DegT/DnrJ/EryC1/StrS family aminotransferase [Candidatus Pelagibacter sp.]
MIFKKSLRRYNSIGKEEIKAANEVLKSGALSPFLGSWPDIPNVGSFYGGKKVQLFERNLEKFYGSKYAITVNSWTSGLIAAVGAIDVEPGDEIITSPWTMCATVTSIIHWAAIPVFADIEEDTFNLDINSILSKINKKTKAIIIPEIFGHPFDVLTLKKKLKNFDRKIYLISDNAQSPLGKYKGKYTCNFYDIGGFSYNYHKHIQTGEGGALVTNSKNLAERMYLIRNHGEAVVGPRKIKKINNIIGYNFRMGEIEAAIGSSQLKKVFKLVKQRISIANFLSRNLKNFNGLTIPKIKDGFNHNFYVYALKYDSSKTGISRDRIVKKLKSLGAPVVPGYANIHLYPMFQKKIAYGKNHFPWSLSKSSMKISYNKGICPISENMNENSIIKIPICDYQFSVDDQKKLIQCFLETWKFFRISSEKI